MFKEYTVCVFIYLFIYVYMYNVYVCACVCIVRVMQAKTLMFFSSVLHPGSEMHSSSPSSRKFQNITYSRAGIPGGSLARRLGARSRKKQVFRTKVALNILPLFPAPRNKERETRSLGVSTRLTLPHVAPTVSLTEIEDVNRRLRRNRRKT